MHNLTCRYAQFNMSFDTFYAQSPLRFLEKFKITEKNRGVERLIKGQRHSQGKSLHNLKKPELQTPA